MARTPPSSAEAYELFVRGKLAMRAPRREQDLRLAEQLFEQAVHIDPNFSEALAWLSLAQAKRFQLGLSGDEVRRAGMTNARRALAIDPTVTMARRALIAMFGTTGQAAEGLEEASILSKSGASDTPSLEAVATAYEQAGMPIVPSPFTSRRFRWIRMNRTYRLDWRSHRIGLGDTGWGHRCSNKGSRHRRCYLV